MITRDFSVISNDVTGVSLSLSLSLSFPLTKVTHAQYRKRFRASYNILLFSENEKEREPTTIDPSQPDRPGVSRSDPSADTTISAS